MELTKLPFLLIPWFNEPQQQTSVAAKTFWWKVLVEIFPTPMKYSCQQKMNLSLLEPWSWTPVQEVRKMVEHVSIGGDHHIYNAGDATENNGSVSTSKWRGGGKEGKLLRSLRENNQM